MGPKKGPGAIDPVERNLTSESVQGAALALQSVDDIHGGHSLALGMLSVGDGITDDILKEDLQNTTGLLVDETRDTLDSTTAGQTANGWLGNTLDVVTKYLPVTLGAPLSEPLASFASSRHCGLTVADSSDEQKLMQLVLETAFIYWAGGHVTTKSWIAIRRSDWPRICVNEIQRSDWLRTSILGKISPVFRDHHEIGPTHKF